MTQHNTAPLSPLDRIQQAIGRITTAAENLGELHLLSQEEKTALHSELSGEYEQRIAELEAQLAEARDENEALRAENAKLSNQVQDMQQDYHDLQQVTNTVCDRIQSSVTQLDMLIEPKEAMA